MAVDVFSDVFKMLGVSPNEVFQITGQSCDSKYRITKLLDVERCEGSGCWSKSSIDLKWFLLGRYSNGNPLSIIKTHKTMTIEEVERELGYEINIVNKQGEVML